MSGPPEPKVKGLAGHLNTKKRKAPSENDQDAPSPSPPPVTRPNKKPKQKKNPQAASDEDALLDLDAGITTIFTHMDPVLLSDHLAQKTTRFGADLSSIEIADLHVPAGAIKDTTTFAETRTKENLAVFLEQFSRDEDDRKRLGTAPKKTGAPHTIVVAGAGLRAADLVRATRKFQTKESLVAKLFAKHFKVEQQVEFLNKHRTGIAVGTPQRLMDLLDKGALSVAHLKRLVVDASHIDMKKRGILDMKDTMMPLAKWLTRKEFKERYSDEKKPLDLLFF